MKTCENCAKRKINMYDDVVVSNCDWCGKIRDCIYEYPSQFHGSTNLNSTKENE